MAVLANPGYCDSHRALVHRDYGRMRRSFDKEVGFYQSSNWRRLRANFLRLNPLCKACADRGQTIAAVVVDHITPIKEGGARLDKCNLQSLCVSCHNRKTARETAGKRAGG